MNYKLLKDTIAMLEQYENEHGVAATSSEDFAAWVLQQKKPVPEIPNSVKDQKYIAHPTSPVEISISRLIGMMYRYAKQHFKKTGLSDDFYSFDDFSYLATLFNKGPMSKTELIELNIHEKPTGTEIIKRLLKKGQLTETDTDDDKRAKIVSLTTVGYSLLTKNFERMELLANTVAGNLSPNERIQLLNLLQKLDDYHKPTFVKERHK